VNNLTTTHCLRMLKKMTENLSTETFLVHDHRGLFVGLARRLAKTGARVFYCTPQDRRDRVNEALVGDGCELEWTDDLWLVKRDVTCFVFPDIRHEGEQAELRSQGYPVWGSQGGMKLEQNRIFFLNKLKELGLDVPPHTVVEGLDALSEYLKDKRDIYIKMSKWRGSWETTHWRSWDDDWLLIHEWWVKFGPMGRFKKFICCDNIKTDLEIGADTYNIDGAWPETMLHGIERKDKAYFSAVTPRSEMPEQLTQVMDAFSPYLQKMGYRNQWSMENRIKDDKNYFGDATTRGGLPSSPSFTAVQNMGTIIRAGAEGMLEQPDYGFKFSAECSVEITRSCDGMQSMDLKKDVSECFFDQECFFMDGVRWWPPDEGEPGCCGWLRTIGDTPSECFKEMNRLADELPDGVCAAVEDLAHVINEVEAEMKAGIPFTDEPLPDPAIVLE
jgi:hypothetical protein